MARWRWRKCKTPPLAARTREEREREWREVVKACRRFGWDPYGYVTLNGPCGR